jgi:predicted methyltransferase
MKSAVCAALLLLVSLSPVGQAGDDTTRVALEAAAAGSHRSAQNRARDVYRHPVQTLLFFGIKPDMTVVELYPGGGGWYTEILAPFLHDHGTYYSASYDPQSSSAYYSKNGKAYLDKLAADPATYGNVKVTILAPPDQVDIAPAGSADLVLTFRNIHNWMKAGEAETVFAAAYRTLKPGGVFGVEEHRGKPGSTQDPKAESGYVNEDHVIELAKGAGFELAARSEINANPEDTKDYPDGVWDLPPTLEAGEKDKAKYLAIGESDRMTLKFVKPAAATK